MAPWCPFASTEGNKLIWLIWRLYTWLGLVMDIHERRVKGLTKKAAQTTLGQKVEVPRGRLRVEVTWAFLSRKERCR